MALVVATIEGILEVIDIGKLMKGLFEQIRSLVHKENCHHNLLDGTEQEGDICLQKYYFKKDHEGVRKIRHTYRFPEDRKPGKETIHGVFCYDNRGDDKGGKVDISAGGVGAKFVDLSFKSKAGRGLDYTIVIVGQ